MKRALSAPARAVAAPIPQPVPSRFNQTLQYTGATRYPLRACLAPLGSKLRLGTCYFRMTVKAHCTGWTPTLLPCRVQLSVLER